jgi:hypothetical protein
MFVPRGPRYSEEEARAAIAASLSWSEALRRLGMCHSGGAHLILKKYAALWGVPTDHFDPYAAVRGSGIRRRRPLEEILVERSMFSRGALKERLYEAGLKQPICELCGQGELWRGRLMGMILDHINGVSNDHRLENLRIVCPNCAATLETHCARTRLLHRTTQKCVRCGVEFRPKSATQRYCSRDCGTRWDRKGVPAPVPAASSDRRIRSWFGRSRRWATAEPGAGTASRTTRSGSGFECMSRNGSSGGRPDQVGGQGSFVVSNSLGQSA